MKVGENAATTRRFRAAEVDEYCRLGGARPAANCVPEPMIGALFSYLLGVRLPGPGTMYLKQETEFTGLARLDENLHARVEITRVRPEKHLVDLVTLCARHDGSLLARGHALVYVKDVVGD